MRWRQRARGAVVTVIVLAAVVGGVMFMNLVDEITDERLVIPGDGEKLDPDQLSPEPIIVDDGDGRLADLTVREAEQPAEAPDYDRSAFNHWTDRDGDGCNTRAEVLDRDAEPVGVVRSTDDGCVIGATIIDPYSGDRIVEEPGRPSAVDIDHVVSLSDAWWSGAWRWSDDRRQLFANDLRNLLAVKDNLNASKGGEAADEWLPPAGECAFVRRQVMVKTNYDLSVTSAERKAMRRVLSGCPAGQE